MKGAGSLGGADILEGQVILKGAGSLGGKVFFYLVRYTFAVSYFKDRLQQLRIFNHAIMLSFDVGGL